jgi:predicted RND superfamily exporter protein
MAPLRQRIENGFEVLAGWIFRHSRLVLISIAVLTIALTFRLPELTIDASSEALLHRSDPILKDYETFKNLFGSDEVIIVAVKTPDVFDLDFLAKLTRLHNELEAQTPHLAQITSLINVRYTRGTHDRLVVEALLSRLPQNQTDLADLRQRVAQFPLYHNRLISKDGRMTALLLETEVDAGLPRDDNVLAGFDPDGNAGASGGSSRLEQAAAARAIEAIRPILAAYRAEDFEIHLGGSRVVTQVINANGVREMKLFVSLAMLANVILLYFLYRRAAGVVLPPLVVALATASALGLMAHAGVAFTPPTIMLPSFLLAVGLGDSVHLLTLFFGRYDQTGDKRGAVVYALGHCGLAIVMTSLTTAAGLGSFILAEVTSVAHIGLFGACGVLLAMVYSIFLLPAMLALIPVKQRDKARGPSHHPILNRFFDKLATLAAGHAKAVIVIGFVLVVFGLAGIFQIRFVHHPIRWMSSDWPARRASAEIDRKFHGSVLLEVMVDSKKQNGILDPHVLASLDNLAQDLAALKVAGLIAGKTISIADLVKEIHQALNENRTQYYRIPRDPQVISQEMLLFENSGSDDLYDLVDSGFQIGRFTIQTPWANAPVYARYIEDIERRFRNRLGPTAVVTVTGQMNLFGRTITAAIESTRRSYLIAGLVITAMMMMLLGSGTFGLVSMVPNLAPIIITLGLIGWFKVPFDLYCMTMGSIAIGVVVDDTIHFMHTFRRYYADTGDVNRAVRLTFDTTGRALVVTTIVLTAAAFIFMFSEINSMVNFGFFIGLTFILALAADLLLTPALIIMISRRLSKTAGTGFQNPSEWVDK